MRETFGILAVVSLVAALVSIVFAIGWDSLQAISWAVALVCSALFNAFAASVLHGLDRQATATEKLHGAIVASAKGEEPALPTVEDNEVPEHVVRAKYEDDMAGRTLFKPKP